LEEALADQETYYTVITPTTDIDLYSMLADAAAQAHDLAGLQKYAPLAIKYATHLRHTLYEGVAHRALGVMHKLQGDRDVSAKEFYQALSLFKGLGARWQIGQTHLELGDLAMQGSDTASALDHFFEALKAFEEIQARPAQELAQSRLKSLS
jgi:tetratricopeptide (TPR) repeat protein